MRQPLALALIVAAAAPLAAATVPSPAIKAAVADPQRSAANRARDVWRHPAETLTFFGVKPTDTVVEFIPGGGWYSEILAPLVKAKGKYIPLVPASAREKTAAYFTGRAAAFGPVEVATIAYPADTSSIAPGTADVVLTFRNVHNLLMQNDTIVAPATFRAFFAALKPGGTLGVVDHRLPEQADVAKEKSSGYVKRSTIVKLATDAGFRLAGESNVNANPKDTHDHPQGVWTLPPSYALKEVDRAKYQAIGESDRVTLKFVKPAK